MENQLIQQDSLIFLAKDLNFDNYNTEQLDYLCKYRLPIMSNFPKLILYLYNDNKFNNCLNDDIMENTIFQRLINSIKKISEDSHGNIIREQININNNDIFNKIIELFNCEKKPKKNLSKKKKNIFIQIK